MLWPAGKSLAVFVNIAYEQWSPDAAPGISPMGNPLPAGIVDTQARSWGRYGRVGILRLLDVLDRCGLPATVMASGSFAQDTPDVLRQMVQQGHEICGHATYQNVLPALLTPEEERQMLRECLEALESASGVRPVGWISPRGTPSPSTAELLAEAGCTWFGDCFDTDRGHTVSYPTGQLVHLPLTMEVNDLPMVMKHGASPSDYLASVKQHVEGHLRYADGTTHLDVTVHAHVGGRPGYAAAFEDALALLADHDEIWIGTRREAAEMILNAQPEGVGSR